VISAALADVLPRCSIDASMSALRWEKCPQDRLRDVSQLAQAVAADVPGQAEGSKLGAQRRLVRSSRGFLPQVEVAAVGGRPPAVRALDHVGHDDVRVELGVSGPAGAVAEGGGEALGFDELAAAGTSPGITGFGGQVVEDALHRPVMRRRDGDTDPVGPECVQKGDAFGTENVRS
jgi:hypothetical protein